LSVVSSEFKSVEEVVWDMWCAASSIVRCLPRYHANLCTHNESNRMGHNAAMNSMKKSLAATRPMATGIVTAASLLAAALVLSGCVTKEPTEKSVAKVTQKLQSIGALDLSARTLIVDTHIDVPYRLYKQAEDVSQPAGGDFDFPRAQIGGLNAAFMSIYIPATVDAEGGAGKLADGLIAGVEGLIRSHPDKFAPALCAADVSKAANSGRVALPLGMENGGPIAGSFDELKRYRDRGVRYITLAHSKSNHISDSSYDTNERWQGLSEFGKSLIGEMNNQGVMVDISHLSDKAAWQVLELSKTPVIASHSSMRHFTPGFHRNMTDEMVKALGENGGVIQINFGSSFLTKAARDWSDKFSASAAEYAKVNDIPSGDERMRGFAEQYRAALPYPYATTKHVLDHIDRAVKVAGIDHVGIGSDYDGVGDSLPIGLKDVSSYPELVLGLSQRGYSREDIAKVLAGNVLRVWREVENYAASQGQPVICALAVAE